MPAVAVALLVFAPCLATGIGLTHLAGIPLRFEERVAVAAPLGALVVGLWGWVFAVVLGFDLTSLSSALLASVACSLPGWRRGAPLLGPEARDSWRRVRLPWRDGESLRPLVALVAVAWPLTIRIFSLAWITTPDGGLAAGHLSTWADGAAHLAYAGIVAVGGKVPPGSPIAAGEPARYHLLADVFGAQVSLLGVSLPSALAVTSGFLALAFPVIAYCCGVRLTGSRHAALVGVVVFAAGGGLGFVHLADDLRSGGLSALVHLPRSYARDPDAGLWMDNPSLAYLYAQRNGLLGLPLGLAALTLVWESRRLRSAAGLLAAGVLTGLLPLANGFAFLIVLAVAATWLLLDRPPDPEAPATGPPTTVPEGVGGGALGAGTGARGPGPAARFVGWLADRARTWWWFFVPAVLLGAPVAWWLQPPESSVRVLVGWMADDGIGGWVWFWFRNAGPFIVLLAVACLWKGTVRTGFVRWFLPVWLLWVVPNLVAFHPWEWNNTKYFAFWQLLGSFLVGAVVVRLARSGWAGRAAAALAMVLLVSSGSLDLYRATDSTVSPIPWATADGLRVAVWVRDEIPLDAVLALAPTSLQPVTSLSGHAVVSGYPGWTFDIGVPDWAARAEDEKAILRGGPGALDAIDRRGVDFVVIGPLERSAEFGADESWWAANGRAVFRSGDWTVYAVPERAG